MYYSNSFFLFLAVLEDHCHRERNEEIDKKARKKLLIASTLCVIFMIAEIVGNIYDIIDIKRIKYAIIKRVEEDYMYNIVINRNKL